MDFDKIEQAVFESLKHAMISNPQPKGDELPKVFSSAIRKAIEVYDKEIQE